MAKRRRAKVLALAGIVLMAAFLAFMCTGAFAANPSTVTVSANLASVLQLSMSKATVDFGGVLQPGSTHTDTDIATVDSNKIWSLKVTKSSDLHDAVSGMSIPSANLTYGSTSANPNVLNLQASGTQFGASTNVCNTCGRGPAMAVTVTYSLTVPWNVEPGTYTATHTYTATQP